VLKFLSLGNLKISTDNTVKLIDCIKENGVNIRFLTITGLNLRQLSKAFDSLIEFIGGSQSIHQL